MLSNITLYKNPIIKSLIDLFDKYDAKIKASPSGDFTSDLMIYIHENQFVDSIRSHISQREFNYTRNLGGGTDGIEFMREFGEIIKKYRIMIGSYKTEITIYYSNSYQKEIIIDPKLNRIDSDILKKYLNEK